MRRASSPPAPDDRLVAPETRYELEDGRLSYVPPSDEPHGTRHAALIALLAAHAHSDYQVACDMLTRLTEQDDQAPDASVFPRERDAQTGGRQLEELAFEVVSTSRLSRAALKAEKLVRRGVRRVFAVDVVRERVLEWAPELGTWSPLSDTAVIDDVTLAVPLPIAALVRVSHADDTTARALLAKDNSVLHAALEEREARGEARSILRVLAKRGIACNEAERATIEACRDLATLHRWLDRAVTARSAAEVFAVEDE
jgi:Uma2 family endonuclease